MTSFSRFIAMRMTAIVVETQARQIKNRESLCQANEARAAELNETRTCGRPARGN